LPQKSETSESLLWMCELEAGAGNATGHARGTACWFGYQIGHNMCRRGMAGREEEAVAEEGGVAFKYRGLRYVLRDALGTEEGQICDI
jgi:hypothetical protein